MSGDLQLIQIIHPVIGNQIIFQIQLWNIIIQSTQKFILLINILKEAERLSQTGVKELLIISQDTSAYGIDRHNELILSESKQTVGMPTRR